MSGMTKSAIRHRIEWKVYGIVQTNNWESIERFAMKITCDNVENDVLCDLVEKIDNIVYNNIAHNIFTNVRRFLREL